MPLAGGTFTGRVDMGSNILSVNEMSNNGTTGMRWGKGSTHGGTGTIVIGDNSSLNGINEGTIIGKGSITLDTQCTSLGMLNSMNAGSTLSTLVGYNNISGSEGGICVGFSSQSAARNGWCLGHGLTNVTANSLLIGSAEASQNLINIRPQTDSTCDLGLTTKRFNNLYLGGALDNTSAIQIGPTLATAVLIGNNSISTSVLGNIINTNIPYAAWYSNTNYNPLFSANTNRLVPPTTTTAGLLSLFTQSTGVLTYTGNRSRTMKVSYSITYLVNAKVTMTFFNSLNSSTTIASAQTFVQAVNPTNNEPYSISFTDILNMNTNDTIQLGARSTASTNGTTFAVVNMNVIGLID